MKIVLILVLLSGGLFVSRSHSEVVLRDAVVFKVVRKVFSLNDLKSYFDEINNLKCIYPDSILIKIFNEEFDPDNLKFFKFQKPFSSEQKEYFSSLLDFAKLLTYSEAQTVVVKPTIVKYLYLGAKNSGCSLKSFQKDGQLKDRLAEIIRFEVFARSRFLPSEKSGVVTKDDIDKAIISAKNLLKSISRQVDDEVYWH